MNLDYDKLITYYIDVMALVGVQLTPNQLEKVKSLNAKDFQRMMKILKSVEESAIEEILLSQKDFSVN